MANPAETDYSLCLLASEIHNPEKSRITAAIQGKAEKIKQLELDLSKFFIPHFPISVWHRRITYDFLPKILRPIARLLGMVFSFILDLLLFVFIEIYRFFHNRKLMQKNSQEQQRYFQEMKEEYQKQQTPTDDGSSSSADSLLWVVPHLPPENRASSITSNSAPAYLEHPSCPENFLPKVSGSSSSSKIETQLEELSKKLPTLNDSQKIGIQIWQNLCEASSKSNTDRSMINFSDQLEKGTPTSSIPYSQTPQFKETLLHKLSTNFPNVHHSHIKFMIHYSANAERLEKAFNLFRNSLLEIEKRISNPEKFPQDMILEIRSTLESGPSIQESYIASSTLSLIEKKDMPNTRQYLQSILQKNLKGDSFTIELKKMNLFIPPTQPHQVDHSTIGESLMVIDHMNQAFYQEKKLQINFLIKIKNDDTPVLGFSIGLDFYDRSGKIHGSILEWVYPDV